MYINLASVFVDDQDKALSFYTKVLGFREKSNFPVGEFKWMTVTSADPARPMELLLEPNDNPTAKTYQTSLMEQNIAAGTLATDDIEAEFERLRGLGVDFTMPPTDVGEAIVAVFNDTCGNLIQLAQMK